MTTRENDVLAEFGCPRCGERDADLLAIDDDDTVRCLACGLTYRIGDPARDENDHEMN